MNRLHAPWTGIAALLESVATLVPPDGPVPDTYGASTYQLTFRVDWLDVPFHATEKTCMAAGSRLPRSSPFRRPG